MLLIAWRNLWRNRGRTLIIATAIALSFGLFLVSLGIGDYQHQRMEQAAVETAGGNVLVHGAGYWEAQSSDVVIAAPEAVAETIAGLDGVAALVPRVRINGLLNSPRGSAGVILLGIDPVREARLEDPARHLVEGTFLGDEIDDPLVLGRALVEDLQLELGDRVVLTATAPDGEVVRALFHLSGILESGSELLDAAAAYTTIAAAQEAVDMQGALTQLGVLVDDDRQREAVAEGIRQALGREGGRLEVLTWSDAIPDMVGFIEIDSAFNYLFSFAILLVVAFGIANTFLMVVLERIREFGLLGAIGLTPARLGILLLYETLLLAAVAMAVGFVFAYGVHLYVAHTGIDLTGIYGDLEVSGVAMEDMVIRSTINPAKWLGAAAAVFVLIMLSAFYPALRAMRLDPAQAMRTYQ